MEINYPKISIVTPCFNHSKYLERTITSVVSQGYPNLEYIIIDGGSTDGSVDIIKKYEKYITYWVSESDQGMYYALQKGFEISTGQIMGWINSDDILHPGSLFTISQVLSDFESVEWIQGCPNIIDELDRIVGVDRTRHVTMFNFYYEKNPLNWGCIQQESTYWKRSLWDKAGKHISTDYKFAGDFELWMRFFKHAKLYNLNAFTGSFRISESGQASIENSLSYETEAKHIRRLYPLTTTQLVKCRLKYFYIRSMSLFKFIAKKILSFFKINKVFVENDKFTFNYKYQKFDFKD